MRLDHLLLTLTSGLVLACNNTENNNKRWEITGGSKANIKYSALKEIDSTNVNKLQIAWAYHSEHNDSAAFGPMECNQPEYRPVRMENTFWRIPGIEKKAIPVTGSENYGGPVVTAGGILFIGASSDGEFRAFNKRTGKLLWETDLPAPGIATPAVYSIQGKQYVVIACGGSKWKGGKQGDELVAFALPDDAK